MLVLKAQPLWDFYSPFLFFLWCGPPLPLTFRPTDPKVYLVPFSLPLIFSFLLFRHFFYPFANPPQTPQFFLPCLPPIFTRRFLMAISFHHIRACSFPKIIFRIFPRLPPAHFSASFPFSFSLSLWLFPRLFGSFS